MTTYAGRGPVGQYMYVTLIIKLIGEKSKFYKPEVSLDKTMINTNAVFKDTPSLVVAVIL